MQIKFQDLEITVNKTPQGDSFVFEGKVLITFPGNEQELARALAENMTRPWAGMYKVEEHSGKRIITALIKAWSFQELIETIKQRQRDFDVKLQQLLDHRALQAILKDSEREPDQKE